jgi:hypothetical protein
MVWQRGRRSGNRRSLQDPQYWCDGAKEARVHADQVKDPEMKGLWLRIAEGHERQAVLLERLRYLAEKAAGLLTQSPRRLGGRAKVYACGSETFRGLVEKTFVPPWTEAKSPSGRDLSHFGDRYRLAPGSKSPSLSSTLKK